ncbi:MULTISPECIES: cytochrome-c peroxidase [Bacteria]|uniref:Cytochrome c domain-containing protein n=1 Tax=Merismopedia glauca CCAP 1448/3 TaxID=1296344 RepID=A0A2T1C646_9CYAN|nr:cytochrome c peroxidase [Merismopedia glauca]PSB03613.1 hypothetical protein C7B64_07695 [Merismopedia glauca CCAP 1448/3]
MSGVRAAIGTVVLLAAAVAAVLGITTDIHPPDDLGLPKIIEPEDNPTTDDKVVLGRKLFMDRRLSHNNTISCAMCHVPEQAFASNELAMAVGIEGRTNKRNTPTILNAVYYTRFFHDGREHSLENQVIGPLVAFNEMGNPSVGYVVEKIKSTTDYDGMFERAFGKPVNLDNINKAIAAYERTLVSANSKFDRYQYRNEETAMNASEINGFKLFMGKARCVTCHAVQEKSAIFTDQGFHNTGIGYTRNNTVYHREATMPITLAPGITVQTPSDHFDHASERPPNDVGRFEVTENPKDRWAYKTPSLRNVALTAPYMHDGSLLTLESVVDFYDKGGEDNPLKDPLLTPLNLTTQEKAELVAFMKALTGANVAKLEKEARAAYYVTPVEMPAASVKDN